MRKSLIIIIVFCLFLFACNTPEKEKSLESIKIDESSVLEFTDNVDLSKIFILCTYDNGDTETLPVTIDMLTEVDIQALESEGEHLINISFKDKSVQLNIVIIKTKTITDYLEGNDVLFYICDELLQVLSYNKAASFMLEINCNETSNIEIVEQNGLEGVFNYLIEENKVIITYTASKNINGIIDVCLLKNIDINSISYGAIQATIIDENQKVSFVENKFIQKIIVK